LAVGSHQTESAPVETKRRKASITVSSPPFFGMESDKISFMPLGKYRWRHFEYCVDSRMGGVSNVDIDGSNTL
jgi:hypothetical protein